MFVQAELELAELRWELDDLKRELAEAREEIQKLKFDADCTNDYIATLVEGQDGDVGC